MRIQALKLAIGLLTAGSLLGCTTGALLPTLAPGATPQPTAFCACGHDSPNVCIPCPTEANETPGLPSGPTLAPGETATPRPAPTATLEPGQTEKPTNPPKATCGPNDPRPKCQSPDPNATPTATPSPAATLVALNDGQPTTWVLRRIRTDATPEPSSSTIPEANFNPLEVRIEQNGTVLSGSNRDSGREVDVTVSGSVDADGKVDLTITLTNSGSPRQVIEIKNARVTGDGANQTIKGKYEATGPGAAETGNFEMTHN